MSTHNVCFYGEILEITSNTHLIQTVKIFLPKRTYVDSCNSNFVTVNCFLFPGNA